MIARRTNFAVAHWDWLAAFGGFALLAASVLCCFVFAGDPAGDVSAPPPTKAAPEVATFETAALDAALLSAKEPAAMAEIPDTKRSFLASGLRVFCVAGDPASGKKGCGLPIPLGVEKCIYCGVAQKKDEAPTFDTDGDGIPDEVEKKLGLDPADPADAQGDLDGDGFTNIEEILAKTDPADAKSHPDLIDSLRLELPLRQTYTDLVFTGANMTPGGLKLNFRDPKRRADYDRGVYSVYAGSPVGATGFTAKGYERKTRREKMGGGMEKTVDVSEAILRRDRDGKTVALVLDARRTPTDVQAKLVCDRGGASEFLVTPGQEFELKGDRFFVARIDKTPKGAIVSVENKTTGKKRAVSASGN